MRFNAAIGGTGGQSPAMLRKNGPGLVRLIGANTYNGGTAIEEGEVRIHHVTALGSTVGSTTVSDGAVLGVDVLGGTPVIAEPLMLAGQGTAAASVSA